MINFMFTKYSPLTSGSSFILCQKALNFLSLCTLFYRLRCVCFYQHPFFCVIFSTFCSLFSFVNYQAVMSLLAAEVFIGAYSRKPCIWTHFFVQNFVPEHDFCLGVIGGQQHKADTSSSVTCLINTHIYRSIVFSAANSLTMVESEKFGRIQEFVLVRYKLLVGSTGVVWYKVLVTAFIFEHVVPVTSLLGYQTKQKVAAKSGERNENVLFFFINTQRLFETVTETDIQMTLSKRRRLFYSLWY